MTINEDREEGINSLMAQGIMAAPIETATTFNSSLRPKFNASFDL